MTRKIKDLFTYLFLTIISIISVFPFVWMVVGATNTSKDVTLGKISFGGEFMNNFNKLLEVVDLPLVLGNSFKIAIVATILSLILCSLAAYGFEIYRSKLRDKVFVVLLLSMMVPFAAVMIPLFKFFSKLGLLNTHLAVILPASATAFLIFFFRQSTKSFPRELIEAARIDGLNELQIFLKMYVPTMKSTYSAAGIMAFMSSWNNFLWPLIVLQTPDKKTLPLVISSLSSAYSPDYGVIMISILISVLPVLIVFFMAQKNFVEGMVGSVK